MDLKVGVVGFGLRAGLYKHAHRPGEGSVVTMVCDTSERGRADAAEKLPEATITADLERAAHRRPGRRAGADPGQPARSGRQAHPGSRHPDVLREAAGRHPGRRGRGARDGVPHRNPALRRAQHAPHARGPPDARASSTTARSARSRPSGAATSSATAATTTSRTGTPSAANTTGLLLQKGAHDIDVIHWLAGGYTEPRVRRSATLAVYGDVDDRRDNSDRRDAGLVLAGQLAADRADRPEPGHRRRGHLDDADGARQRRAGLLPAVPLHPRLLAQLHRHRHRGPPGELRRRRGQRDQGLEHPQPGRLRGADIEVEIEAPTAATAAPTRA